MTALGIKHEIRRKRYYTSTPTPSTPSLPNFLILPLEGRDAPVTSYDELWIQGLMHVLQVFKLSSMLSKRGKEGWAESENIYPQKLWNYYLEMQYNILHHVSYVTVNVLTISDCLCL